jgi:hypothetical protein
VHSGIGNEIDVVAAATALRRIHDDPAGVHAVATVVLTKIARTRSPVATGAVLARYLGDLYRRSTRQTTRRGLSDPRVAAMMEGRTVRSRYVD